MIDGTLRCHDNSTDLFKNGNVITRKIIGGTITMAPTDFSIHYDDGRMFKGTNIDFVSNASDFIIWKNVNEAILNNGRLKHSNQIWDDYVNGIIVGGQWPLQNGDYVQYDEGKPSKLIYSDGSYVEGDFMAHKEYNGTDIASSYVLLNGFITTKDGSKIHVVNGELKPTTLSGIRLLAAQKGWSVYRNPPWAYGLWVSYNDQDEPYVTFNFNDAAPSRGDGLFYIIVSSGYALSYPKSQVSKKYNAYGVKYYEASSFKVADNFRFYNHWNELVWVYESKGYKNDIKYGVTKALYVIDSETEKVLFDFTPVLGRGNNSRYRTEDKPIRSGVKVECSNCDGKGYVTIKYLGQAPQYKRCISCDGKGWIKTM